MNGLIRGLGLGAGLLYCATASLAVTPAEKCQTAKLKAAGKYGFCRLKADAKAITTSGSVDYSKCEEKYSLKWGQAETIAGPGVCPSEGDEFLLQNFINQHTDDVTVALAVGNLPSCPINNCGNANIEAGEDCDQANLNGATCASQGFVGGTLACAAGCTFDINGCVSTRFVDNGDGTVTDHQTGLLWEKKTDDGSVHDKDNFYSWSATASAADGTAFTSFLGELNDAVSADGTLIGGCFASRCDWRLPTITELHGIRDCSLGDPCLDPVLGPVAGFPFYWSSTTSSFASDAWFVYFSTASPTGTVAKAAGFWVRAVAGPAILTCGNGVLDAGESCDQGQLDGETCETVAATPLGSLACTSGCTFDTSGCIPCPGAVVGGACWVYGTLGADCDSTCAAIGLTYDPATETFAGTGGTTANCEAIISALGGPLPVSDFPIGCGAVGCHVNHLFGPTAFRCTAAPTTSSASIPGLERVCACD